MKQHKAQHFCCGKSEFSMTHHSHKAHHPPSGPDRFSNWEIHTPNWYSWSGLQVLLHRQGSTAPAADAS